MKHAGIFTEAWLRSHAIENTGKFAELSTQDGPDPDQDPNSDPRPELDSGGVLMRRPSDAFLSSPEAKPKIPRRTTSRVFQTQCRQPSADN